MNADSSKKRKNVVLFMVHLVLALVILAWFVYAVVHRS